jgi:23S rRNA (cytidine1920-2'-O)/16S rRNA (cytidine1409-2'-O)-methyltransferase
MKLRLDQLLLAKNLVPTEQKSQAWIIDGRILVNGQKVEKPGTLVDPTAVITLLGEDSPYVSRGGLKLERAIREFQVPIKGRIALDIGASTGGFTDCLLQHGAQKVYAIDVGYGQLAWKLRCDPRVVVVERTNARYLTRESLTPSPQDPKTPRFIQITLAVIDVSFISLDKILPVLKDLLTPYQSDVIALVKPQFEASRDQVGKGGIVKDPQVHQAVLDHIQKAAEAAGFNVHGVIDSPLTGADGNKEFLMWMKL